MGSIPTRENEIFNILNETLLTAYILYYTFLESNVPRMIREAIEIQKHPSFTCDPLIKTLKSQTHHTRGQDTVSSFCRNPGQYARQLRNRWR